MCARCCVNVLPHVCWLLWVAVRYLVLLHDAVEVDVTACVC